MDNRIAELEAFATAEGIILPYPPQVIARLEDTGAVVDLITGSILIGEADRPFRWELTPAGQVLAHLLLVESEV